MDIVSTALQLAVNETTIPEPTALEVAAESILNELTDGDATTADVAAALQDALEAIKKSVAEELANTKLTVGISLGAAANEMESTTTGDMEESTTSGDMESTTIAADLESTEAATDGETTSTMSPGEETTTISEMESTTTVLVMFYP